jgi:hypothetical protein
MRYQSDFWLLGHKVWLEAKQLEGKRQIILPIIVMSLIHKGGEHCPKRRRTKAKKTIIPHILSHTLVNPTPIFIITSR